MRFTSLALTLGLGIWLAVGCSPAPRSVNFPYSTQEKVQAAEHWRLIAKDLSESVVASLAAYGDGAFTSFAVQTVDRSPFGKALSSFLVTDLVHKGYAPAVAPGDSTMGLRWSVQIVRHDSSRMAEYQPGTITAATMLGFGVYKAMQSGSDFLQVTAAGVGADLAASAGFHLFGPTPHTEIIVTLSAETADKIWLRQACVYYVNDVDAPSHYWEIPDRLVADEYLPSKTYVLTTKR